MKYFGMALFSLLLLFSCNNGPKVLESQGTGSRGNERSTGIFSDSGESDSPKEMSSDVKNELHTVHVEEVLPTDKYVYLRVKENGTDEFWVATRKMDVEVGASYFFRGGLLKTQFESKEYNRIFDKVYLVSKLVPTDHSASQANTTENNTQESGSDMQDDKVILKAGSISIKELVSNKNEYDSKSVQLTGKVVKVNPNIMNRNWIHLKDGSLDDYDLVLTSNVAIPEGHVVSLKGIVKLDQDFGAGYTYELIVENAELVR